MDSYSNKGNGEEEVKIKVEDFDPRMFYQQNCIKPDFPSHSQNPTPIKITKPSPSDKVHLNSSYARLESERNNNFGNTSSASGYLLKKQPSGGGESVLGISNDVYPEDTCRQCGKVFPGPISVRTHQIVHRIVPPKTKICCCGERFHLRSGLENHMRICRTTEVLQQQQQQQQQQQKQTDLVNSTYYAREPPKPQTHTHGPAPPPPAPPVAPKQNLISIVTTCPNCGNGAMALADIHAEPITFHCSQCGQEIKNVMFVRILQDGAADANAISRDAEGVTLPIKQDVSYIISDAGNHGC